MADTVVLLLYVGLNSISLYPYRPVSEVGSRAANLSLVNMIALYASPRLESLAGILGISLSKTHRLHFFAGIMSFTLLIVHLVIFGTSRAPFNLRNLTNRGGLTVSYCFICF